MSTKHLYATKITDVTADKRDTLGEIRYEDDRANSQGVKTYRYVQYVAGSTDDPSDWGHLVYFIGSTPNVVTRALADAQPASVAGVTTTAINNTGYYAWIQTGGFCRRLITDENVAAYDPLVASESAIGVASSLTVNTQKVIGVALAADSGSVLAASFLRITR